MARRSDSDMEVLKQRWKELLWREEFFNGSLAEQAKELGVTPQTVSHWRSNASDAFWEKYVKSFKEKLQPEFAGIMMAMIKKAKGGDVAASQFVFQRAEGWSPKNTQENLNKNADLDGMTLEEKKKEALKLYTPEELAKALAEKKAPGVVVEWPENEYSQPKVEGGHGQP